MVLRIGPLTDRIHIREMANEHGAMYMYTKLSYFYKDGNGWVYYNIEHTGEILIISCLMYSVDTMI